jgi:hypothetical protein
LPRKLAAFRPKYFWLVAIILSLFDPDVLLAVALLPAVVVLPVLKKPRRRPLVRSAPATPDGPPVVAAGGAVAACGVCAGTGSVDDPG